MIITVFASCVAALFSTAVMSYISLATPIGPWIAPTLVLLLTPCIKLFVAKQHQQQSMILATVAGSIGGIMATAFGFSFPTLYFLDPVFFMNLMAHPLSFCALVSSLALTGGSLGLWCASIVEPVLIDEQQLPFPIGTLVYGMIAAQEKARQVSHLIGGFVGTVLFCALQTGVYGFKLIPTTITIIAQRSKGIFAIPRIDIRFDQLPMLWSIGFITGEVIAIPLLVGLSAKLLLIDPLYNAYFKTLAAGDFLMAFCSGMVLIGAASSFISLFVSLYKGWSQVSVSSSFAIQKLSRFVPQNIIGSGIVALGAMFFFSYFEFSLFAQLFIYTATAVCTYQIAVIAGKIGLATLGRFATFVMVPALLVFKLNSLQVTLVATFVELCGGVAVDALFGRKIARLGGVSKQQMQRYQLLGLVVSSLAVGVVLWLLINQFGLASEELMAQRAQARALLVNFTHFNYYVLLCGMVFGYFLKQVRVNALLVLGGLLMTPMYSLSLICGGLSARLVRDPKVWEPLWSGIFAGNSIWMIVRALS